MMRHRQNHLTVTLQPRWQDSKTVCEDPFLGEPHMTWPYLEGVCEEVMVEHGPVLAANVNDDFAEFVTDEIRNRFVLGQQKFRQTAADLHLVLRGDADPHLVHKVLEGKEHISMSQIHQL